MDMSRHKTYRKTAVDFDNSNTSQPTDSFKNLLEDSAREAYSRPWHRLERGLRLNRFRIFIEDIAPQYEMILEEREGFFLFIQKALDKKLLNTLKIVNYDQEKQRITAIRGLEIKRNSEGIIKWGFSVKKINADKATTRKKKKEEIPSISTHPEMTQDETKIEGTQ
jgi:hypothetical protein